MAHLPDYTIRKDISDMIYNNKKELIKNIAAELGKMDQADYLIDKYLDNTIKLKAKRDPAKPKNPKSGYNIFSDEHREAVKAKHPNYTMGDFSKHFGKEWKDLKNKDKYYQLAEKDKERYREEMIKYNNDLFSSSVMQYANNKKTTKDKKSKKSKDEDENNDDDNEEEEDDDDETETVNKKHSDKKHSDKKHSDKKHHKKSHEDEENA